LLEGCNPEEDFEFEFKQLSPREVSILESDDTSAPLTATFVLTNTGRCLLVEGEILRDGNPIGIPVQDYINTGVSKTVAYPWGSIADGEHEVSLRLRVKDAEGEYYTIETPIDLMITLKPVTDQDDD
jgi:hypothetical protein